MSFLNPIALWGLLAIGIPILIHLWNGKRGKTIAWAAMDFLSTAESQVSKGFKLENYLVLILRIMIITILVFLLAQLALLSSSGFKEKQIVHVLTGEKAVWEEFRFEIQQALDRDEAVILATNPSTTITTLDALFENEKASASNLQTTLDGLPDELDSLILYLPNSNLTLASTYFSLPVLPNIKVSDASLSAQAPLIKTQPNQYFKMNRVGVLDSVSVVEGEVPTLDFSEGPIPVWIKISETERAFIAAALESITDVYGIEFRFTEQLDSASVVFSNKIGSEMDSEKLYFFSNSTTYPESSNQIIIGDSLTFTASEMIRSGQFPEFILEKILASQKLGPKSSPLKISQLEHRFLLKPQASTIQKANLNEWLLLLLLAILGLERLFAMKQRI